ncbi:metal-dependent transcriptional regulator [Acholeplasma sp. OttesenSCG-928-E16]|nr:metal-dependent transcriptional regulator [Acholeplasma sp. OttesenSCG-928-E16]
MIRNESIEDYLEQILILSRQKEFVRSIDIANSLNYSKPSISIAMKKLLNNSLISIDAKGHITLTKEGLKIALDTYERHETIATLLIKLGVNKETALEDACKIEHDISEETFNAIKNFLDKNKQ